MNLNLINLESIEAEWLIDKQISLDILRLDKIHPVVSGNKWFKLKYYLHDAINQHKLTVATFGGAWSNHIIATAFAAREAGLNSFGIIRGEKPAVLSYSIKMAIEYGMDLQFVTRQQYKRKEEIKHQYSANDWYWIDEGGYGVAGAKGAAEIVSFATYENYTHIIAAVGTGTMLAGLVLGSSKKQNIIGISSMKGNYALEEKMNTLTGHQTIRAAFEIKHDYHFGGYGKHPQSLLTFMNDVYNKHHLPLDIIYTGKTFFAIKDLTEKKFFKPGSRLLMIHSGGLQGNKSLPDKVLAF